MYLLYVDESGLATDSQRSYFVLAGVAIFERAAHWIETELEAIARRFNPAEPHLIGFHGSPMRTGVKQWRKVPLLDREQAIMDALHLIRQKNCRVFAAVMEKQAHAGKDVTELAFEQLSSRFDQFLGRLYRSGNTQRGLILFDKRSVERRIQSLTREFRRSGHSFGKLRNFADVPVFVDSEASRLIQLADLVAYAIYRKFEFGDTRFYDVIASSFDAEGGVVHGLYPAALARKGKL